MVQLVVVWGLLYYIACFYYIVNKMPETNKLCVMLVYFNYHLLRNVHVYRCHSFVVFFIPRLCTYVEAF
jgi:hypothetical protein